jgi:hypothetical protein
MAAQIETIVSSLFLIFGVSHAVRPQSWADFFAALKRTGFAQLIIPMYTLPMGLLIVVCHNRWAWGWPLFITLAGWGMTIKSGVYLLLPQVPNRVIDFAAHRGVYRLAGAIMAVLGLFLTWKSLSALSA